MRHYEELGVIKLGKQIIVEKPFDINLLSARDLVSRHSLQKRSGRDV
jgi:hypothetical protein